MTHFRPYSPRPIRFLGLAQANNYQIKQYSIVHGDEPFRNAEFARGLRLLFDVLPQPAVSSARPGVGFAIGHQGNGVDYAVLAWWDNENELPIQIMVRPQIPDGTWRPARNGESVCVWDLEVIWWERQAYVATVLSGGTIEEYLNRVGTPVGI